jgi:hypothetical protein
MASNAPKVPGPTITARRHVLTRHELYRLVWSVPMLKLAVRFGVSGRGLAKICERARIPVPKPGYWAKIRAGQQIAKVPLPEAGASTPSRVLIKSSTL